MFGPNQFETDNVSAVISQVQRFNSKALIHDGEIMQLYGLDVYRTHIATGLGDINP